MNLIGRSKKWVLIGTYKITKNKKSKEILSHHTLIHFYSGFLISFLSLYLLQDRLLNAILLLVLISVPATNTTKSQDQVFLSHFIFVRISSTVDFLLSSMQELVCIASVEKKTSFEEICFKNFYFVYIECFCMKLYVKENSIEIKKERKTRFV